MLSIGGPPTTIFSISRAPCRRHGAAHAEGVQPGVLALAPLLTSCLLPLQELIHIVVDVSPTMHAYLPLVSASVAELFHKLARAACERWRARPGLSRCNLCRLVRHAHVPLTTDSVREGGESVGVSVPLRLKRRVGERDGAFRASSRRPTPPHAACPQERTTR